MSSPPPPLPIQPRWISSRGPCAGCKHLRRKCQPDCVFAPYFPASDTEKFSAVHRVFGASNAAKILLAVPLHLRQAAANSLVFEARERCTNLVFGTCGHIAHLNTRIQQLERCIHILKQQIRRQELHILQALRQSGGGQQQQYQSAAMPYASPPVTVAIAPRDTSGILLRPPPATGQQLEQNNSSRYLSDRVATTQSCLYPTTVLEPRSDQELERNNSSGYSVDNGRLCPPPATVLKSSSRQQVGRNNSSGHSLPKKNNSSGHYINNLPKNNNSSGHFVDSVATSEQQYEQNNSSEYLFDKVV